MAIRRSTGASVSQNIGAKARKMASVALHAQRGAIVQRIREGTPNQIAELLDDLEDTGNIETDEGILADRTLEEDVNRLEMDAEIDISDEDTIFSDADDWSEDEEFVGGDSARNLIAQSRFEIIVRNDDSCYVPTEARLIRKSLTPLGTQVLDELAIRMATIRQISNWLSERRTLFLRTCDIWDLGCEALEDMRQGRLPVQQKSFSSCVGLGSVSEASLSRYIRETQLVWGNGSGPLDILFSKAAQRAWVANAFKQFCLCNEIEITEELLSNPSSVRAPRQTITAPVDNMDLFEFIKKANQQANTRWKDVLENYWDRILYDKKSL